MRTTIDHTMIKKIAVLRANALGDFIFALPALTALRETYPQAEICYLGKPWHKAFLQHRPSPVDRVIVIPPSHGVREEPTMREHPGKLKQFFAHMQQEQFDVAIQLHGGGRNSNLFLLQLKAKLTVGMRTPDAPLLDRWIPYIYYQNEMLRLLEVVSLLGATTAQINPSVAATNADRHEAERVIGTPSEPLVILHPGATDLRRRWPEAYFAAVGDMLARKGYRILVTGVADEKETINQVIAQMRSPAENLCGKLSLSGLTGLLQQAALVISNDTGPLHLAAALGTPTIGIYWCGNMINGGLHTRKRHYPAVSWVVTCPLCGKDVATPDTEYRDGINHCGHTISFVNAIKPDEVLEAALDLLQRTAALKQPQALPTKQQTDPSSPVVRKN